LQAKRFGVFWPIGASPVPPLVKPPFSPGGGSVQGEPSELTPVASHSMVMLISPRTQGERRVRTRRKKEKRVTLRTVTPFKSP
jgi:hypothetical protein